MTLEALFHQRNVAVAESYSVPSLAAFPLMIRNLLGFTHSFSQSTVAIALSSEQNDFIKEVNKHSYMDLALLTAYVPEGLEAKYLPYSELLKTGVRHAQGLIDESLSTFSLHLSQLITEASQQRSSFSLDKKYLDLAKQRDSINNALGNCFKRGSTRSERKIGDVIDRNADWPNVFNIANENANAMNGISRKIINKKLQECGELLTVLTRKIENKEFESVSPEVVRNLSEGTYQLASELEFYSVIYYKVLVYTEALNKTMLNTHRVFKLK